MLSDFITQDKSRKYTLNDRGQLLYHSLRDGNVLPALNVGSEAFTHKAGRWLFLSPVFSRVSRLGVFVSVSVSVLLIGAFGSALAKLEPQFFFYFASTRSFESLILMFLFYWIGLFLIADAIIYVLFRRTGNDLQLFACVGISALPLAMFPYIYMLIPKVSSMESRFILLVLQVWTLLLTASAFSFGKGLRLDRSIIVSLIILYLNIALLVLQGRLS